MRERIFLASALLCLVLSVACEEGVLSSQKSDGRAADLSGPDSASADLQASDAVGAEQPTARDTGASPAGYSCNDPAPAWLFCDDFEGMAAGFDSWLASSGWTSNIGADDSGRMTRSTAAHRGSYAVHYPAAASAGYQGAALTWRPCLGENRPGCSLQGYPQLYFRAYVRFAPDHHEVHHFLNVGGGPLDDYWGNHFTPEPPVPLPLDQWFCLELMMRANDVGQHRAHRLRLRRARPEHARPEQGEPWS